jgi:WD40 repeat protein
MSAHNGSLRSLLISGPNTLYSLSTGGGTNEDEVLAWDLRTRKPLKAPGARPNSVLRSLRLSPDGRTLAVCGNGFVELWPVD